MLLASALKELLYKLYKFRNIILHYMLLDSALKELPFNFTNYVTNSETSFCTTWYYLNPYKSYHINFTT